ncbi:MAG: molybdopterin-dependent oxidoreductase [Oscillospiraceae bacterium]|nr:molybdopterin-dependent oxidoreductase [Oscillospiraceae bacterium]MCD8016252.1 molybdopterin-dependent oxidoreductase [Oscillospiraceae bacterium]
MTKDKFKPDKETLVSFSLMGPESGGLCWVDSKDGKIVRTRPYYYDKEYTDANCNPWTMEARGKKFVPMPKVLITHFGLGYKSRVYSKNRVLYPMKRVDWDPNGERHPETRGKSKYVRISWDEAAQLCADELKRMKREYGPEAVLCESDMHGEGKNVAPSHGCPNRLLSLMGGYTLQMRNMDSWEGWYWGAKHVWGCEPVGEQNPQGNLIPDMAKNCDSLLFWGCDPEVTPLGFGMHLPTQICYWFTELGIKSIYICPEFNYGAVAHADKWIPVLPNTDAAMQLAIAYMWLTEEQYDKEYIEKHTYGFDKFVDYVMGKEDGVPKTPKWASEKCGVSPWTIKALARHWAKRTVSICHGNGGSYIRGPYSSEPARLEIMLLGMQGLGKPGVHQTKMIEWNMWAKNFPVPFTPEKPRMMPHAGDPLRPIKGDLPDEINMKRFTLNPWQQQKAPELCKLFEQLPAPTQFIPRCLVHKAITEGHAEWYGMHMFSTSQVPDKNNYRKPTNKYQFEKIVYPRPGQSRVHMIWSDTPCNVTCWNHGNLFIEAYRDPSIETIVEQHIWMENDCYFADIILPVCTMYEMNDIGNDFSSGVFQSIYKVEPATEPVGEALTDFDVCVKICEKLGPEYVDAYTGGGLSEEDRVRLFYKVSGCEEDMSYEEWAKKKVFVIPCKADVQDEPAGFYEFYKDPANHRLTTPTGLLEYSSSNIEKYMPDDPERPPVPHWIEKSESHDERLSSERAEKYPLLLMSNHGRWRVHAQCDDIVWNREIETMKIRGKDGYQYEPVWLSPEEAEKRGIKTGDIVKVFNERGIVLCGAYVTPRLRPNVCYVDHGARLDPIDPGHIDRGGCINSITPTSMISKNCTGMATSGFLAEVEKLSDEEMEDWKKKYPEAFARKVDPDAGVCLEGWLEGGIA